MTIREEYEQVNNQISELVLRRDELYNQLLSEINDNKTKFKLIVDGNEHDDCLPDNYGKILKNIIENKSRHEIVSINDVIESLIGYRYGDFVATKEILSYFGFEIDEDDYSHLKDNKDYSSEDVAEFINNVLDNEIASFEVDW